MSAVKSIVERSMIPAAIMVLWAALSWSVALAEDAAQTDTIVLKDGTSMRDCVVMDENWREVQAYRPADGQKVTLPQANVERIDFGAAPLLYRVAQTSLEQGRWQTAADTLAQVLNDESAKSKPWVKQYVLYDIAESRRVLAELAGDAAALQKVADAYAKLLQEVPETKFKHEALLAVARCAEEQAALAATADEKAAAVKRAEDAYRNFDETCKKDFTDAAFAAALALRAGQAQIGALSLKYQAAAGAENLAKLAAEFRALAGEAGRPEEIVLEANLWATKCDLVAADKSGADATGAVGELRAQMDKIAASGVSQGVQEMLLVKSYSALGDHYFARAQALPLDKPERKNLDSEAALSYLRITLMYPLTPGAEAQCQNAFYRSILIMKEMGEVYLAKNLYAAMGEKFSESDFWKNTASKMLTQ